MALDDPKELDGVIRSLFDHPGDLHTTSRMHCPTCGGDRRMYVLMRYPQARREYRGGSDQPITVPFEAVDRATDRPVLLEGNCADCEGRFTIVRCAGPDGATHLIVPTAHGGIATPNTHPAVAFYLDQADRAQHVGALSASVAMYRAALEQLLFHAGYRQGMLDQKLKSLDADRGNPDPKATPIGAASPKWLRETEHDVFVAMKELGNAAIHPNGGDHTKQAKLDADLCAQVKAAFGALLADMEAEHAKKARAAALQATVAAVKK